MSSNCHFNLYDFLGPLDDPQQRCGIVNAYVFLKRIQIYLADW